MRSLSAPALLLGLVVAGCLASGPTPSEPGSDAADEGDPRPALVDPVFTTPLKIGQVPAAEPSIVAPRGMEVYVVTPLWLWRSDDGGLTYTELGVDGDCTPTCIPPGRSHKDPGLDGGGDGDMAGDANGTLYWAGLFGEDASIPFQVSRDRGETWSKPFDVAEGNSTDREWIDATPDGRLYVVWRDFADPEDADGEARLLFRTSPDEGATWDPIRIITDDHLGGPVVHDPSSDAVYMPYYDREEGIVVARTRDLGLTWDLLEVGTEPATPSQGSNGGSHIFPVAAVDAAGTLYVVWSVDAPTMAPLNEAVVPTVRMAVSHDQGQTWSEPLQLSAPGKSGIFPWIVAGKPGRIAVAWYEGRFGAPGDVAPDVWDVVLKESVTADLGMPVFAGGAVNDADKPIHLGFLGTENPYRTVDRTHLDFFEVALRPDGQPVLTWASHSDTLYRVAVDVYAAAVENGTPLL